MNIKNPPLFKPVETAYRFASTECVVTHSVDKMGVKATMREDLYESMKDNINILQHLINGIKISEEDTMYNHYRYKCSKVYFDKHGVQTARLDIKVLKNHPDAENCLYIEVNPNKSFHDENCLHDLETLLSMSELYFIEKMDIAIDIPISKYFVHLITMFKADFVQHLDLGGSPTGNSLLAFAVPHFFECLSDAVLNVLTSLIVTDRNVVDV